MATKIDNVAIDAVIKRNMRQFRNKGVLSIRPGFKFTGGWITDKPAIVATVDKKLENLPAARMLPPEVENVPVDVREATGLQRLRASDPAAHDLIVTHGRREFQEPDWKFERNPQSGKMMSATPMTASAALRSMKKPEIDYVPAPGVALAPVIGQMTIIANASPDAGWPVLRDFMKGITSRLTVGMYDFTSKHILDTLTSALLPSSRTLDLVLDHPPRNASFNQTDDQTKASLESAIKQRAKIDWALTRNDPVVDAWIFPTAYHIKVAVRDGDTFWLSSGNWNNSNQPDLSANNPSAGSLAKSDRDWHVIIANADLAKIFEAYFMQDLASAARHQGASKPAVHSELRKAMIEHAAASAKSSQIQAEPATMMALARVQTLFPAQTFSNIQVKVDPTLTPDPGVYSGKILALLKSATRSLYMQTQYIHPSDKPVDAKFDELISAVRDKHKAGVDVRLITSQYENTPQWIEKIKQYDLDSVLRIQDRVHKKGIVIDSNVVALGSQNWSGDGTLRNRDASVIIYHQGIAQYFEKIFLDDWTNRAKAKVVEASHPVKKPLRKTAARKTGSKKKRKAKSKTGSKKRL